MKLVRLTAVDYDDDDELTILLAGRDENNERVTIEVLGTVPYFYVEEDAPVPDDERITDVDHGYHSYDGIPLKRISTETPGDVGSLAGDYESTWESDIPFYRRASIDYGLSGYIRVPGTNRCHIEDIETDVDIDADELIEPRIFIADIEVLPDAETSFTEMTEDYNCPISHITIWDSYEDEYIALYLDESGAVDGSAVKSHLEAQDGSESLLDEMERAIILRRYETEESLYNGLLSLIEERRPDLTSGWNWVDFDWDYILNRAKHLDVDVHRLSDIGYINGYVTERRVDCLPAFDMMDAYKKMTIPFEGKKRSWSLDYISKTELDAGKIVDVNISRDYFERPNLVLAYNIIDTMLCVALDRQRGIHEFFYELAELSQIQIYDTFSEMRLVDGYIMSNAGDDEILPPQTEKDIPENAGGLVLNPSTGIHDWVGVIDLKSLYPSAIITWNISPETIHWYDSGTPVNDMCIDIPWLPDAEHADGGDFAFDDIDFDVMWSDLNEEGLIPRHLKRLFPERDRYKRLRDEHTPDENAYKVWDNKQTSVKVIMNSFYGVMSNDYWRLGQYGLGDATTSTARYALWQGKEIAQSNGSDVIYGDTDSVMVSLAEEWQVKQDAIAFGRRLEDTINSNMDICVHQSGIPGRHPFLDGNLHGTNYHCLVWEFEKLYRRFFQAGKKKRYAGLVVWKEGKDIDNDIDTSGFESQRSDSPELTEIVQPEVIRRILMGQGFDEISEYIRGLIDDVKTGEMPLYHIALPKTLNKAVDEYGNTPAARAARFSNQYLDGNWSEGDDPWMYYIESNPPMTPSTDVIALNWDEEIPVDYEVDYNKHFERALKAPLKPILDEVGWRYTELTQGAKTQSAEDWSGDWEEPDEEETDEWGW